MPRPSLQGWVQATSPDGRLKVEQIRIEGPADGGLHLTPYTVGGDLLVKDAATDEVRHRIAVPDGAWAQFAAGSQRLLVQYRGKRTSPETPPTPKGTQRDWLTWELYDTDKWRLVASGEWLRPLADPGRPYSLVLSPAGRWCVQGGGATPS